jgi:6-phosphogluconolactonase (cycloisomerase 2 family)
MGITVSLALGCSGGGGGEPTPRYLYVGSWSAAIGAYAIDPDTGALTPLPGSPVGTAVANPLLPTSNETDLLYISGALGNAVEVFQVAGDGSLASLGTTPVGETTGASSLITRNGEFLLVSALYAVRAFAIGDGGALTAVEGSRVAGEGMESVGQLVESRDGRFIYAVGEMAGGAISACSIDADGMLSELGGSPYAGGGGAFRLALSPDGRHLYEADYQHGTVVGWELDPASGALAPITGSPWNTPTGGDTFVAIHPTGKWLYTSDAAGVAGFTIGSGGSLAPMASSPFTVAEPEQPYGLAIEPSGRFLYLTDGGTHEIHGFVIGSGGALTEIVGSPWSAPTEPGGIVFVR